MLGSAVNSESPKQTVNLDVISKNISNCCLVCGSKKVHYDFSLDKYRVEECVDCNLMRLNPQPSDAELGKIYSDNYFIAFEDDHFSELKQGTAEHYLNVLASYTNAPLRGRLLEIGCGQGDFLVKAAERGLDVTGVEYSQHAVDVAQAKLGTRGTVICGEIQHLLNSGQRFDYIIFADVLEHVRNPREFLRHVHSLLNKDGVAAAIVPSLDSFSARLMRNKWVEFKPEHLWYFSSSTMKRLFYTEGFNSDKIFKAKKTLSIDYIAKHFEHYPVQPYTNIMRLATKLIPRFVLRHPIRVVASGIMFLARKNEIQTPKKLSVVMAVYNEATTARQTIDSILKKKINNVEIELIIVESNSNDGTRAIVQEYTNHERVKVILQDKPSGKGNAVREGLKNISGDFVLIQDADDEYDLEDYDALIEPLMNGEATFVLGARHGGSAWKMRKFENQRLAGHILNLGHWMFTTLINVLFMVRLRDPFTMYKVFRADCLDGLNFRCDRFDFDCELLIKLVKSGHYPIEIPVNYRSRSFKEGKKVRVFQDPLTWLRAILRLRVQKD